MTVESQRIRFRLSWSIVAALVLAAVIHSPARAQNPAGGQNSAGGTTASLGSPPAESSGFFQDWFKRVDRALASEPSWAAPLVMATPRVVELFRFDTLLAGVRTNVTSANYGLGRGLSLVPNETTQVSLGIPGYIVRNGGRAPGAGFADLPIITIKERLLSANAANGDYILTAFLSTTGPTGATLFSENAYTITPGLYGGKGWGNFNIQGSIGGSFPFANVAVIGNSLVSNLVFQYRLGQYLSPELELNNTYWFDGLRRGKDQTFLTLGAILGRFNIAGRFNLLVGAGYQVALTPAFVVKPAVTPVYARAVVTTFRLSF